MVNLYAVFYGQWFPWKTFEGGQTILQGLPSSAGLGSFFTTISGFLSMLKPICIWEVMDSSSPPCNVGFSPVPCPVPCARRPWGVKASSSWMPRWWIPIWFESVPDYLVLLVCLGVYNGLLVCCSDLFSLFLRDVLLRYYLVRRNKSFSKQHSKKQKRTWYTDNQADQAPTMPTKPDYRPLHWIVIIRRPWNVTWMRFAIFKRKLFLQGGALSKGKGFLNKFFSLSLIYNWLYTSTLQQVSGNLLATNKPLERTSWRLLVHT